MVSATQLSMTQPVTIASKTSATMATLVFLRDMLIPP
ncbi:hypothetical protein HMPREF0891_1866 [Lactobacillus crispatus 214-1]|nr:hypothetical protein HMPREF0891_1866 [Lactobacillus crispatus 214-1]